MPSDASREAEGEDEAAQLEAAAATADQEAQRMRADAAAEAAEAAVLEGRAAGLEDRVVGRAALSMRKVCVCMACASAWCVQVLMAGLACVLGASGGPLWAAKPIERRR